MPFLVLFFIFVPGAIPIYFIVTFLYGFFEIQSYNGPVKWSGFTLGKQLRKLIRGKV